MALSDKQRGVLTGMVGAVILGALVMGGAIWLGPALLVPTSEIGGRLAQVLPWDLLVVVWLIATALSTWLIVLVEHHLGLRLAWLAKPIVEGGLAVLTFLAGRYVIYR